MNVLKTFVMTMKPVGWANLLPTMTETHAIGGQQDCPPYGMHLWEARPAAIVCVRKHFLKEHRRETRLPQMGGF